jgi:tRNA (mo5U34)-methyltransferase
MTKSSPLSKRAWDIREILSAAREFEKRLNAVKQRCALPKGKEWYAYHTFSNLTHLTELLTGDHRKLLALTEGYPLLDIGCADGDLAYFFEDLGLQVHAIDHPATNYNNMDGVRALKKALDSSIEIRDVDLDRQFVLPRQTYGLVLLFGTLYHLKNPFYVLEALARRSKYCVLSTRVAQFTPDHKTNFRDLPMAYLLGELELNNDYTNYWIFSEMGLRRLFERTGWRVCDFATTGARGDSDPVGPKNDERAFCLLESRVVDKDSDARLAEGWHGWEGTCRWTARRFTFVVRRPPGGASEFQLRFLVPDVILATRPSLTLTAQVNGYALPPHTYATAGEHVYEEKIPLEAAKQEILEIVFETRDVTRPPAPDTRELGVFVPFEAWFPLIVSQ